MYLAIAPPTGSGATDGMTGPPPSLLSGFLSDLAFFLAVAFTSRPALALLHSSVDLDLPQRVQLSSSSFLPSLDPEPTNELRTHEISFDFRGSAGT